MRPEYNRRVSGVTSLLTGDPRLRWWARAFAVASLVHLTLPDVREPGWLAPAALEALGALWLLWRPAPAAFLLCALGTIWPLALLRDVLTQSMWLSWVALIGAAGAGGLVSRRATLDAVRLLTAGTYALAVLHKLNTEFFDPAYGCAHHAWAQVVARYPLLDALPLDPLLPYVAVGLEASLAIALVRKSRLIWPLGVVFHLPLTVTLAPAFAAVMFAGYAAAVSPRDLARLRDILRRHGARLAAAGLAAGALEVALARPPLDPVVLAKAIAAGALLAWTLPLLRAPRRSTRPAPRLARLALAAWLLHGLTPYVGVQYQHTAAMLSNLRIDAGCHNSLVFPESLRGVDPYVRIDRASIGDGARPRREQIVTETLWNVAALHTMRRNWCVPALRPIRYEGTWRGAPFVIADLCADGALDAFPGPAGFQRFQKNLPRACPAACIH